MNKLEQAARALLAHWDTPAWKYLKPTGDLMADLREALAEPELNLNCKSVQKRLATVWGYVKAEQAEQKPIGYVIEDNDYEGSKIWAEPINGCCLPVYLAPVRTKDLTDDEIWEIADKLNRHLPAFHNEFARTVIAADREKNRG